MVEVGDVAEQAQPLAGLPQRPVGGLRRLDLCGREVGDLLDAVDQAREEADGLAVAGVTAARPGVAHAVEPAHEVGVRGVEQAPHGLLACPRHQQVRRDIVVEQVLEEVGPSLHKLLLAVQVLMGVDQAQLGDVRGKLAHIHSF